MALGELKQCISAAGGGENARAYAESLLSKINRIETVQTYSSLLKQLCTAKERVTSADACLR
jgi:hypothetical protein